MKFTYKKFKEKYPDDNACLDKLFRIRFSEMTFCPDCAAQTSFYRVKKRKCYECKHCGYQIFPMANTIFHNTKTPLTDWFHAMYLMTSSKNGVSAKEIERAIGVTYKCAWRMAHQLRKLMGGKADALLSGKVQVDEAFMGGHRSGRRGRGAKNKTIVLGMVEENGSIIAKVIPALGNSFMLPIIQANVAPGSHITTDEFLVYRNLHKLNMTHDVVKHRLREFVNQSGNHTNTIEGFWSILKRSISGTHVWVSSKYLHQYVDEFEFRYNNRHSVIPMFELALEALRPSLEASQNPQNA